MVAQNHIHRHHWHRLTVAPWREIEPGLAAGAWAYVKVVVVKAEHVE